MAKRKINKLVVHCSATKPALSKCLTVDEVREWHTKPKSRGGRGWSDIGYHYFIDYDGRIHTGRPLSRSGAHVKGHNRDSVGICYAGGLDDNGQPCDTRTPAQAKALRVLLRYLKHLGTCPGIEIQPGVEIVGHRDLSPDTNKNGKVDKHEWLKDCPCFEAKAEYQNL